jgi:uncharacterized protein
MTNRFLALATQGKNAWWRYAISILLILFFYQIIGAVPLIILGSVLNLDAKPSTRFNSETFQFEGIDPLLPYLVLNFAAFSLLLGLFIAVCSLHERKFITLVTPNSQINWKRVFQGFKLYFILILASGLVGVFFSPNEYQFAFKPVQFLLFLPFALFITPIQTSAEELLFRGYLMQGIGLKAHNPLIPILGSSLLFTLPHLANPEVKVNFWLMTTIYFCLSMFLAVITVKDNSLELAIGVHAANNLFVVLVLNYADSVLPSPAIFTASQLNPLRSLISLIIVAIVFYIVIFREPISQRRH